MKIFYSWQSDTPNAIGRSFIRSALDSAVSRVSEEMKLDEADRPTVDQDTQGVMGSPAIAETIFGKIRESAVVVVDVTLVAERVQEEKLISSNVAYELGYAHGYHGDQVLLAVMNVHYGLPEELPFDLKHRRWPVRFDLAPESSESRRRKVRSELATELARILKLYLEKRPPEKRHERSGSTANPATYWQEGELLIQIQGSRIRGRSLDAGFEINQPLMYLRIWPDEPLAELSGRELADYRTTSIEPLAGRLPGHSHSRNKYGAIAYYADEGGELYSCTQVLKNREIWGVQAYFLRGRKDKDFDFVPTSAFEEGIIHSLHTYLRAASELLGYPNVVHMEAGLVNVEGFFLAMPNSYVERFWGPLFEDVSVRSTINRLDPESRVVALLSVFDAVFDAAGAERPQSYNNFPGDTASDVQQ